MGLENPLPRWLTHMCGELVLYPVGAHLRAVSQGAQVSSLWPLEMAGLGF